MMGSLLLVLAGFAQAKEETGIEVKVCVVDVAGAPVPTAIVRHPQEADRHRVNAQDGCFPASSIYTPDGTEIRFTSGMDLTLEISAPGYQTEVITYQVRKRRNNILLTLQAIEMTEEGIEEPIITFKQDKPREATESP